MAKDPLTLDTFFEFLEQVFRRPGMFLGGSPDLERLDSYLIGLIHGSGIDFDESRMPIHHFLNSHFKDDCGSQVLWTHILKKNLSTIPDEDKIKYMYDIWPQFKIWQVLKS